MPEALFSDSWYRVRALVPSLRAHAEIGRQRYRGETWYVLRDSAGQRFHRFSPAAHAVIGLMDGRRSVEEIWQLAADELGDDAPTQDELIQLLGQLHMADVLRCDVTPDVAELFERGDRQRSRKRRSRWLSPFAIQIPLVDPDRFLARTIPYLRPLFGWVGALLWLAVVLPAAVLAGVHWTDLTHNFLDQLLSLQNILVISLVFPVLKVLHELGHGYIARRFGCEIHEMGVMFLVFAPIPYVDASSSWALASKYQRALVGAGGMLVELLLAALAFYVWLAAEPGAVRVAAYNAVVVGGATTLLFNGNPLLRFDGYYIFSDLIEIPNLRARANRYVGYVLERYLLGSTDARTLHTADGEPGWLLAYSVSAFVYRCFVVVAILTWILDWNFVLGAGLALFALVGWFGVPAFKVVQHLLSSSSLRRVRGRAISISVGLLALVIAAILVVPLPLRTQAEGVVWVPDEAFVRAGCDGFVSRLVAEPGTSVARGELLIELHDPELATEVTVRMGRVRELEASYTAERSRDKVAAQIIRGQLEQARRELDRARERAANFEVRAAAAGQFVVPRSEDLPGRFVSQGQLLAYVVDLTTINVRAVVPQDDIHLVREHTTGARVRLSDRLSETHPAIVKRIVPGATERLPSVALGSGGGGEVAVDPSDSQGDRAVQSLFEVELELPEEIPLVAAGGRVYVRFDHGLEPLAAQWYRRVRQLFLSRFEV
jgi:putative peptide zinc metalloprotease protein